jgi:hypothetical protein
MTGTVRGRRSAFLVAIVGLLVAVGAGAGQGGDADQFRGHSPAAVSATGVFGSAPGGALDTRIQRHRDASSGQRASDQFELSGVPSRTHSAGPGLWALAGALERAGHPERLGHIFLRGPPSPSA